MEDSILTRLETLNKDFWFEMNYDIILFTQTITNNYKKYFFDYKKIKRNSKYSNR